MGNANAVVPSSSEPRNRAYMQTKSAPEVTATPEEAVHVLQKETLPNSSSTESKSSKAMETVAQSQEACRTSKSCTTRRHQRQKQAKAKEQAKAKAQVSKRQKQQQQLQGGDTTRCCTMI